MECSACEKKKIARKTNFVQAKYVIKNKAGAVVREYGSRIDAATAVFKNPGYTLHPVNKGILVQEASPTGEVETLGE